MGNSPTSRSDTRSASTRFSNTSSSSLTVGCKPSRLRGTHDPKRLVGSAGFTCILANVSATTTSCIGRARHQNWNFMCADCHSTAVRKNYDAATNTYATTWTGSTWLASLSWAWLGSRSLGESSSAGSEGRRIGLAFALDEREDISGHDLDEHAGAVAGLGTHRSSRPAAICHARRQAAEHLTPDQRWSCSHDAPADAPRAGRSSKPTARADEVYNYGSFAQSKMFMAGVSCGDCHEPHSLARWGRRQCRLASNVMPPDLRRAASHHRHRTGAPARRLRRLPHAGDAPT